LVLSLSLVCGAALVAFACSDNAATPNTLPLSDAGKKKDTGKEDPPDPDPNPNPDPEPLPDSGKPPGRVFAHTRDTLFIFEPIGRKLTAIGKLACLAVGDDLLDIAIDQTGNMYGTTRTHFIKIVPTDATCTIIGTKAANQYPNSLSFVPQGTVDPQQEALVGYSFDQLSDATIYTRIDLQSGEMTDLPGNLNPGNLPVEYGASGDFISLLSNNKTYLTVKQVTGDAGAGNDLLAEIDPATGKLKSIIGDIKHKQLYGFGFANGKGYGFTNEGKILEVDLSNGSATVLLTLDGGTPWYGAGVTTDAK